MRTDNSHLSAEKPATPEPSLGLLVLMMVSLLSSYGLLMAGTGLFGTFIVLRAGIEGFSRDVLGLLVASYYAGMMLGTLRCGPLVNRIGHIRAFAAFSAIMATTTLAFPFATHPAAWCLLRAVVGFNIAGVFMVAESWLNHKATAGTRGTLLSMYMMTSYLALGGGQLLINVGGLAGDKAFMLVAILFGMAVVPVAVTRATYPPPVESAHFNPRVLMAVSPVATVACVASGLSLSALWGMGPVFASGLGLSVVGVSGFMTALIMSALLFQYPIGRLSDRVDRRSVLLAVSVVAALASVLMVVQLSIYAATGGTSPWSAHAWAITAVACLYGGSVCTLYSLGVAYANDHTKPETMLAVGAGLVLAFGIGATLGAVPAGLLMEWLGPRGLFVYTAAVAGGLSAFILYRAHRRPQAPVMEKEAFVALPEATSTPLPLEADPRTAPLSQQPPTAEQPAPDSTRDATASDIRNNDGN